jgi:uncharacterized membrane protein
VIALYIEISRFSSFIGHLHPLLVHLPIGILCFVFILSLLSSEKREVLGPTFSYAILASAVSSLAACIAGYTLAQSGEYDADSINKHQWTGIATCILCFAAYFITPYRRLLIWITCGTMAVAGHLGGTITHGEGYLFSSNNNAPKEKEILIEKVLPETEKKQKTSDSLTPLTEIFLYRDQISPILQSKCYACHSDLKMKGGLRLDSEKFIRKGGKNGVVLTSGDPEKSPLYAHLILPLGDDLHMPPKGKRQPTIQEIQLIHNWIKNGSPFGGIMPPDKEITTIVSTLPVLIPEEINVDASNFSSQEEKKSIKPIPAADPESIEQLEKLGLIVLPIQNGSNGLSINFVNIRQYDKSMLEELANLKDQIINLRMSNQAINDNDLQKLIPFKNLRYLQIEKSKITDEGMDAIAKITSLEQLNLYGTNITDKGLEKLQSSTNLKVLYLWKTNTTLSGISRLKKALPTIKIESGNFEFTKVDTSKK